MFSSKPKGGPPKPGFLERRRAQAGGGTAGGGVMSGLARVGHIGDWTKRTMAHGFDRMLSKTVVEKIVRTVRPATAEPTVARSAC
jgi:hypothetical protein